MAEYVLYHHLENPWDDKPVGNFKQPTDYISTDTGIYLNDSIKPGIYKHTSPKGEHLYSLKIFDYLRLPASLTKDEIKEQYPQLGSWAIEWPRFVGRYTIDEFLIVDVVFGHIPLNELDGKHRYLTPIDLCWTQKEIQEWTGGQAGLWLGEQKKLWNYDLRSATLAAIIMKLVNELPPVVRQPIRVVRHLAAAADAINRADALLHGKWDGSFEDGVDPANWCRTGQILNHRHSTGTPAKYAQCWVFSEVLTSAYRFLGIPARTVHANNARIDRHRDGGIDVGLRTTKGGGSFKQCRFVVDIESVMGKQSGLVYSSCKAEPEVIFKGDKLPVPSETGLMSPTLNIKKMVGVDDGIWNFHLWNEVYIARPDLPKPFDVAGWQCIDASPIVPTDSEDYYAGKKLFGPCPLRAIKDAIDTQHDFKFLFSAVNSVYRVWRSTGEIHYVTSISYSGLDSNRFEKVTVHTRNPNKSTQLYVDKLDLTDSYTPTDQKDVYTVQHERHPILFVRTSEGKLKYAVRDWAPVSSYYIQLSYLGDDDRLLLCYRQTIEDLKSIIIPDIPIGTHKVSTLTVNKKTKDPKLWWVQVC